MRAIIGVADPPPASGIGLTLRVASLGVTVAAVIMVAARAGCCVSETFDRTSALAHGRSCVTPTWLTAAVFCGIPVDIIRTFGVARLLAGVAALLADSGGDAQDLSQDPDGTSTVCAASVCATRRFQGGDIARTADGSARRGSTSAVGASCFTGSLGLLWLVAVDAWLRLQLLITTEPEAGRTDSAPEDSVLL